jgi:endonuclease/exonuclease/phosphatase (EEP) superfamily protein YafD
LVGFLDRLAWPFEIVTVFRLQYAGLLLLLGLLALLLRLRRAAAAAAVLCAVNLAVVADVRADRPDASVPGTPLRLLLVNLEAGNDRYGDLERLVREARPSVLGVTELDSGWVRELERRLPAFGERLVVPRDDAYGIGVYSRVPLEARVERFPARDGPATVVARVTVRGAQPLTFVVTHVHTPFAGSIHKRHLDALAAARPRLGEPLVLCGDFNAVPWAAAFRRLADHGLAELDDGMWPDYSWPTWSPLLRLPIDNCLSAGVSVRGHRYARDIGSDHYPLIVDLAVP